MNVNAYMKKMLSYRFLFSELVKRDFKQKYKRTTLGMLWSILYPLLNLLVMRMVFTHFFGRNTPHYTTYLFAGNLCMSFFRESTKGGMGSLMANANIITKINVPKYLFLFSKNISAIINFALTFMVFLLFVLIDRITFTIKFICLLYPIICLTVLNIGIGLILSAMYVFFRDTEYFYDIFLILLNYVSAIFYSVDGYPQNIQRLFLLNPIYCNIKYMRTIVIDGNIPSLKFHLLILSYSVVSLLVGGLIYKKKNHDFVYYM